MIRTPQAPASGPRRALSRRFLNVVLAAVAALVAIPASAALVAPGSISFGAQSMGTTTPVQSVTFTNNTALPVTVATVSVNNAQFAQANNCAVLTAGASCTINVTFTPAAAGGLLNSTVNASGTLTIVSSDPGTPHNVPLTGVAEKSLITHYYRSILRREPDAGGKAFWQGEAARVGTLGANVNETWFAMAQTFYNSGEYAAFNRDVNGFVTDLYNTFFNRPPDGPGLAFWAGQINSGMPREVALVSFMFSAEFVNFTTAIFGNTAARAEVDVAGDFYRGLLQRIADNGGFDFWVGQFRSAQCVSAAQVTAQVEAISSSFATSGEYAARARTNAQFVGDLYNAFLRRGGDLAGVQFWINQINTGARTRENVRQQFVAAPEFQSRVLAVINQGCFNPPPASNCALASVLCVGGANSEFATIQAAVNVVTAGQTVAVFDGNYAGFRISNRNGTANNRITVRAVGNNVVINAPGSSSPANGIEVNNCDHLTIEGFRVTNITQSNGYGIRVGGASPTDPMQGVIIRNNTVTGSRVINIYASNIANSLIEGNTTSGAMESHGIYLANGGSDNTTIRANRSFNNFKNGLHLNGDLSIGGDGMHQGIVIEGNFFYDNTANAMDLDGMYDSIVRNNVVWGNGNHGVRVFQIDAAGGARNLQIYNNTLIVGGGQNPIKLTADAGGHTIFNNILLSGTGGSIVVGHPNVKSNHNIVMGSGFSLNEGSTSLTLANWRAQTGNDQNSIQSNATALFVNAAGDDYKLKAGAPAANAGVASFNGVAATAFDVDGVGRPRGGTHDMGAYESF